MVNMVGVAVGAESLWARFLDGLTELSLGWMGNSLGEVCLYEQVQRWLRKQTHCLDIFRLMERER